MAHPDPDRFDEIEEIFAAALAAGDAARTSVLDARCGTRADLRAEVESLLAAHARAGDFIADSPVGAPAAPLRPAPAGAPGMRVGAFCLIAPIARGGMGEVFRAERVEGDFPQQVAIKLMATRLAGVDAVRRFRAERRILAGLQHPNIVSLLDGGVTPDGRPFIAMEFIDGLPITEYCHRQALPLEPRLRLFQQLCAGVDFAHRHLVVHRDLKPVNVLVTAEGIVKVLDFGVAKLLGEHEAGAGATAPFLRPMTTNYASPEQVRGLPVTTASDVYALGVIVYEIVAGVRPYETAGRTLDAVIEIVAAREPRRPSAAGASGMGRPRGLTTDLDAIVLKAMAKAPEERYGSAAELSDDIARLLEGAPVVAREPTLAYLARRTVARHRAAFGVAAVGLVLLVAALIGALWQARAAARARERAVARFNDVRELAGALIFRIHDQVAPLAGSTPVRQTVIAEGLRFLERLGEDAAGDAELQIELARAYVRMGNVQGQRSAANLGDREAARRSYRKAVALAEAAAAEQPGSPAAAAALVNARLALSDTLDGAEARAAIERARREAADWHRRFPRNDDATLLYARATFFLAVYTPDPASLDLWLEADRLYRQLLAADEQDPERMRNVALTQKYLAAFYQRAGEYERALEHSRHALGLDRRRVAAAPGDKGALLDLAIAMASVGFVHELQGDMAEAIAAYRESLDLRVQIATANPKDVYARGRVAHAHTALSSAYLNDGQLVPAREHASRSLALLETLAGIAPVYRAQQASARAAMARVERAGGRLRRACALFAASRDGFDAVEPELWHDYGGVIEEVDRALDACAGGAPPPATVS